MRPASDLVVEARKYLGDHEDPMGSNDGYWVRKFQSATGAYRAPWCVSFLQYVCRAVLGYTIADSSAGVFYVVGWARKHGLLQPVAAPGLWCAFLWGSGHIGIVESVTADGLTMTTIEGNAANQVLRRTRPAHGDYAFVLVPGTTDHPAPPPKPKPRFVPRFQLVTSENGKTKVLLGWSKWAVVQARAPRILAKYRAASLRRKLVKNI